MEERSLEFFKPPRVREVPPGLVMTRPGTSRMYKTGDWRTFRPVIDRKKCTACGLCWVYCPDGSMSVSEEGVYGADLDFCKGCGTCSQECPAKAISMVREGT